MLYPAVRYRCFELATILDMGLATQGALFSVSRQHSYLWNLIAFLVLAFFFATPITLAIEKGKITELSLLVYNTHGLPTIFAKDRPRERFPEIVRLTHDYDISMLQEDFAHHDLVLTHAKEGQSIQRGEGVKTGKCLFCSGSGLTLMSNLSEVDWRVSAIFEPFENCSGWLNRANDCFAQKGFQIIDLRSSRGEEVVLVNTHLDAGRGDLDRAARAAQLDQLILAIDRYVLDQALIVAGDLNLDWDNSKDRKLLFDFRDRLGLARAEKGDQAEHGWTVLDYIFFRSGRNTKLVVVGSGEDSAFVSDDVPLSDHPALFARFSIHRSLARSSHKDQTPGPE